MILKELKPRKALNKAFLKVKPNRTEIEGFKSNLIQLLDRTNDTESEEFHKNLVIDFLKKTYYDPNHFVNTKGRNDLVIHNGDTAKSTVGVIIEAKKPTNKSEMVKPFAEGDTPQQMVSKLNAKAFQELVLYYLRERITQNNLEIKHLIITNINEWFIFDATTFDRLFAQNKKLVKQFQDFEGGRMADTKTDFFYKQIAEPFIAEIKSEIEFTHFNLQDYQKPLRNDDKADDNKLIALFKLLSPEHLLKLPFTNDSNSLDKRFYGELLHIIGLTETKVGSKKIIERNKEGERNTGSFLENAMIQLDSLDKISRLEKPSQFGTNQQERLFNVGLELSITWINRILFLKLLEAQLVNYHKGDKSFEFLSTDKIKDYDDLNSLFFQVLARKQNERNEDVKTAFSKVPYLNSSLFEPTEIEHATLFISQLRNDKAIPLYSQTVLKDDKGKKRTGEINPLEYLFAFLSAYDFTSEGSEEIQEDNKTLINASVLGLIFEKINGYKDGSFFTPGFITMYMCRETIRKSVIQKFNETKGWNCNDINSLYDKIEDRSEANKIVNDIKICDPAVGSGHFLVSALNEMIAIKSDLKILQDREGRRLKEYHLEVVNDELIVTDEDGELFEYNPTNKESQRIQETLFHEKQTIIENCLFGVDINPNSVKICRLRLWIELLKNAYYKNETELETLPNIDINIKCGNSLISRFDIDADLKQALKKSKWSIDSYRVAVDTYRNAESKEQKREMERLIADIKSDFRSEIALNDPKLKRLRKLSGELFQMTNQGQLFEMSKREKAIWNKKVAKLTQDTKKLEAEIEEIKANKIFENAFEWRFEFPEVLNDSGDFVGFDVVIGNPPYIRIQDLQLYKGVVQYYSQNYNTGKKGNYDIYVLFIELGLKISVSQTTYILPHKFINSAYGEAVRKLISDNMLLSKLIHFGANQIFEDATTYTCLLFLGLSKQNQFIYNKVDNIESWKNDPFAGESIVPSIATSQSEWKLLSKQEFELLQKINKGSKTLNQVTSRIFQGIKTSADKIFIVEEKSRNGLFLEIECPHDGRSYEVESGLFYHLIKGGDSQRYFFRNSSLLVLFPYDGGKLIEENILSEKYPLTYKYLCQHKEYLEQRESGRFKGAGWYQFGRHQAIDVISSPKIFTPDIAPQPHFMIDQSGDKYFTGGAAGGYGIVSKNLDSLYLLGVLNSSIVKWYISKTSTQMRGGWYSFESRFIKSIPIKSASITLIDSIAFKVKNILQKKKDDSKIDIAREESQIDQLVYQLYDLTEEEIKIVEGNG